MILRGTEIPTEEAVMGMRVPSSKEIGERIRTARELAGTSGRGMTHLFGANTAFLSNLELGKKKVVGLDTLWILARAVARQGKPANMSAEQVFRYLTFQDDWHWHEEITIKPHDPNVGLPGDSEREEIRGDSS